MGPVLSAILLLIMVFITLRQARKLPKSYIVEVVDLYGQKVTPDGLRLAFKTYDAAESYAQFYRDSYNSAPKNYLGNSQLSL